MRWPKLPIRVDEVETRSAGPLRWDGRAVLLCELVAREDQRPALVYGLRIALVLPIERFDVVRVGARDEVEKVHDGRSRLQERDQLFVDAIRLLLVDEMAGVVDNHLRQPLRAQRFHALERLDANAAIAAARGRPGQEPESESVIILDCSSASSATWNAGLNVAR